MKHRFVKSFFFLITILSFSFCARTGSPEGGPKDETPPLFVASTPPYKTTNFDKNVVKLNFSEYIKLKDLNKQLIVSPPLKNPLSIFPQNAATKKLKLEILDTLKPNTTYIFNFGDAVTDNSEGNVLEAFKYVFSTGNYIDSLTTSGSVKDAFLRETPKKVNVLLYRLDSTYNDSIVYKKKPYYVASTLDSTVFNFSNLKEGDYKVFALQEKINDYIFSPDLEKIGFLADTISLPKDSIIKKQIVLFKERKPYRFRRAKEVSKGKIQFGFEGENIDFTVKLLSNTPKKFTSFSRFEKEKDTLNYWFTPFKVDSLLFSIKNANFLDTVTVNLRKQKIDSLKTFANIGNVLHLRDTFYLNTNNPLLRVDPAKISLTDKDTLPVSFRTHVSKKENKFAILFKKKPNQKYTITLLPGSFEDIYNIKNDTLKFKFTTKDIEDYGRITLNIVSEIADQIILDLIENDKKEKIVERVFLNKSKEVVFDLLEPKKYGIRAIIDSNKNNKWDTGDYLKNQQPENIMYLNTILELRANYYLNETFTLKK